LSQSAPGQAPAAAANGGGGTFRPAFVMLGDSITQFGVLEGGWTNLMAGTYERK
jgi:hypothetical protein